MGNYVVVIKVDMEVSSKTAVELLSDEVLAAFEKIFGEGYVTMELTQESEEEE